MALFRKTPSIADLIDRAGRIFEEFTPDDDYLTEILAPFLAELYAALQARRFEVSMTLKLSQTSLDDASG